jgi:hypothetical protein
VLTQERNPSEFGPATEEANQSALYAHSTFVDIARSTTAGHLPHSVLELSCTETTTSASQLEASLHLDRAEKLPESHESLRSLPLR